MCGLRHFIRGRVYEKKFCCWFDFKTCCNSQLEQIKVTCLQGKSLWLRRHGWWNVCLSLFLFTGSLKCQGWKEKTPCLLPSASPSFLWRKRGSRCVLQWRRGGSQQCTSSQSSQISSISHLFKLRGLHPERICGGCLDICAAVRR